MALSNHRRWGAGTLILLVGIVLGTSGCGADAGADEANGTAAVVEPAGPGSSPADPAADTDDDPLAVDIDDDVTTTALRNTTTRAPSSPTSSTTSSTASSTTSPTSSSTTTSPRPTTSVTTPSSTTTSQTTPSTTGTTAPSGGGLGDVIGCQVLEPRDVRLEVLNSSQQMQTYGVAFELLDGGVVIDDSYAFITGLGPGERTREAAQTVPHTASSCRVTAVEPVVFSVDTTELEAASECGVDLNAIGVAGVMTVTNRTGSLIDSFEGVGAVYDGEGIRRGTGRILSDSVPDGESRPASLQTFVQTSSVAGWTCQVIEIEAFPAES